jgi:hypothetical protein
MIAADGRAQPVLRVASVDGCGTGRAVGGEDDAVAGRGVY